MILIGPLPRKWCLLLFTITVASLPAPEFARANEIYTVSLIMDGSSDPPGDRIETTALLFPEVRDATIEVRAFTSVNIEEGLQNPVRATGDRNSDPLGLFRVVAPLRKEGKSINPTRLEEIPNEGKDTGLIRFDREITAPYSDLNIAKGANLLFYEIRLVTDGRVAEVYATEHTQVTVTDKVRTEMLVVRSVRVPNTVNEPIDALVWKKGILVPEVMSLQNRVYQKREQEASAKVQIAGEYRRKSVARDKTVAITKDFVPVPRRTIHFATNRDAAADRFAVIPERHFGNESVLATDKMIYGACLVSIPVKSHKPGMIEVPGTRWLILDETRDPSRHFLIEGFDPSLTLRGFLSGLAKDDVLVYVHGYNNTFSDSILRAAQLQHDVGFSGKVVVFSWPSAGSALVDVAEPFNGKQKKVEVAYRHDEELATRSYPFLATLLAELLRVGPDGAAPRKVHVIAHSMGNRVLLKALHEISAQKMLGKADGRLGEIVLAAADVDGSTFSNVRSALLENCERVTFYYASGDVALLLSRTLHQDKPIGLGPLFDKEKMDTISAENLTSIFNKLGHLYVAESRPLLTDLRLLINRRLTPLKRRPPLGPRMEAPDLTDYFYWTFNPERP